MTFNQIIEQIQRYAEQNHVPILRPESSQILQQIVQSQNPKHILEIGTAIGYSGLLMLKNAPNATLTTIEKDAKRLEMAKSNFANAGYAARVDAILADANQAVKTLKNTYDFIFLDGPKSHYIKQLPYLLAHLELGGILMADNVLFMGEVLSSAYPKHKHRTAILRLREFLQAVQNNNSLQSKLIDVEDGLLIAQKIK